MHLAIFFGDNCGSVSINSTYLVPLSSSILRKQKPIDFYCQFTAQFIQIQTNYNDNFVNISLTQRLQALRCVKYIFEVFIAITNTYFNFHYNFN